MDRLSHSIPFLSPFTLIAASLGDTQHDPQHEKVYNPVVLQQVHSLELERSKERLHVLVLLL